MKILHVYPKSDEMVAQHVAQLMDGMQLSAEVQAVSNLADFKIICKNFNPDIVHCHGCWQYSIVNAGNFARRQGIRIVLSPHGQLEPWVLEEKPLQEKFRKTALWQKPFVEKAYALIAFGKMEHHYLAQLKWNPRIEVISNAVITNSTTREKMCSQTFAVYQKILDSNVLEQMDDDTLHVMSAIIKAGILGDKRWT
jgi:glycosyltransferase involved in cell wall biosynthesis